MADAYGMSTFKKSENAVVDLVGLQTLLNQYEWDNSGAKWGIGDSGLLYIKDYAFDRPQYPTAIPKEVEFYEMFDKEVDGFNTFYQKSPELMTDADWDNLAGIKFRPIDLQKLSEQVMPFLKFGWIEIACVANEKVRYVYFELSRINADGSAYSRRNCSGPCVETEEVCVEYCPSNKA